MMKSLSKRWRKRKRGELTFIILMGMVLMTGFISPPQEVLAFDFDAGGNVTVDLDTHLQWSGGLRMKDPAAYNLADINADDGNRNFDKHDWVNNLWSVTVDLSVRRDDIGFFVRPRAYYDIAYKKFNANDSPLTNNNFSLYGGPLDRTDEFMDETLDLHRDKVEILDAYAFGIFPLGDEFLDIRVGRQVVNWGQSLFAVSGIGSSQNPLDATKANIPGTELRDLFLPTGQAYANVGLPGDFSLAGFYAWQYEKSRLDESGAYFNSSDYYLEAGRRFIVDPAGLIGILGIAPTVDRRTYEEAGAGQYGAALQYVAPWLMDSEFGFYYMNYHDKFPMLKVNNGFGGVGQVPDWTAYVGPASGPLLNYLEYSSYDILFKEDIKLYGMSVDTTIGTTNVGVEVNYRKDMPVLVLDPLSPLLINTYTKADVFSAVINAVHLFGPAFNWNQLTLIGELGMDRTYDLDDLELSGDDFAWGGILKLTFDWLRPFPGLYMNIKVPISYSFRPHGNSPVTGSYSERADSINITTQFDFYDRVKIGLGYTDYLHDADENGSADRDLLSAYVKYSF